MIPGPFRNLALIGFMGAGKSSAGEALAARLGWSFLDADREIEREAGRTIAAIFEEDGEPAFRSLEERVVGRLLNEPNAVLALGGGSILSPVTRERLREASFTVLLDVSPQTAWRRIEAHAGDRPLAGRGAGVRRALRAAAARSTTPPATRSSTPRTSRARRRSWRRSRGPRRWRSCPGSSARGGRRSSPTGPCCACSGRRSTRS